MYNRGRKLITLARRTRKTSACLVAAMSLSVSVPTLFGAAAQNGPLELDLSAAQSRLIDRSDAIDAANADVRSKEAQERSVRTLGRPELSADVQALDYEKNLDVSLGSFEATAAQLGVRSPIEIERGDAIFRPIISATVPFYTGGRIDATKSGARAQITEARAVRDDTYDEVLIALIKAYYGQQLADQALTVRRNVLDGLERHESDVNKLEEAGLASRAQSLQAKVARDDAERRLQSAIATLATANETLAQLLRAPEGVTPSSPLFVNSTPLAPIEEYKTAAQANHPQLARIDAVKEQAEAGIRIESASKKPEVYGFARYNLNADNALITDPDWIAGVGVRYTLFSGRDRNEQIRSARETRDRAASARREIQTQIDIAVAKRWFDADAARQRFLLQESAIASAEENLRLQTLAHREQQSTSLDVIDAQLGLERAQIERSQAAYEYIVALAELTRLSGDLTRFNEFQLTADRIIQ